MHNYDLLDRLLFSIVFELKIQIVKPDAVYDALQRMHSARMQGVACPIYIEFLLQSIALSSAPITYYTLS